MDDIERLIREALGQVDYAPPPEPHIVEPLLAASLKCRTCGFEWTHIYSGPAGLPRAIKRCPVCRSSANVAKTQRV